MDENLTLPEFETEDKKKSKIKKSIIDLVTNEAKY
jgi:hypothetical protein